MRPACNELASWLRFRRLATTYHDTARSTAAPGAASFNDRITELLAVAQRRQRKPAAEKPPIAPPEVTGETKQTFDERPKPPPKPTAQESSKTRVKPIGRKPVPSHLEAEEHAFRPDTCARCGSIALDAADVIVEEKHHVVKEHQRRRIV